MYMGMETGIVGNPVNGLLSIFEMAIVFSVVCVIINHFRR